MKSKAAAFICVTVLLLLSPAPARSQTPTLKVGLASLSMFTVVWRVAQDKGFFEKEGLNVELSHFESGSINMKALLARAVDVADVETGLILGAASNGADVWIFGTHSQRLHFALYAKKDIAGLKDLRGRSFGISGIGGLPHLVLLALLDKEGLQPDSINLLAVGGTGARLSALAAGKIDATLGEFSPKIEAEPEIHRLLTISDELPLYMAQGLVVWGDTLSSKRDSLERLQRAMIKATRWAYDNKAEMIEAARKHLPLSAEDLSRVYDFYIQARVWAINGEVEPALVTYMQNLGVKTKTQATAVDVGKLIAPDINKSVAASLGSRDYPKR